MRIIVGNVSSQLVIGGKDNLLPFDLHKELDDYLKIRPNRYQYSIAYRSHKWDGYRHFLSSKGIVATGFLPLVIRFCLDNGVHIEIEDERFYIPKFKPEDKLDWSLGEWDTMEHQKLAVTKFNNYIDYGDGRKLYFPRGIGDFATNAGKNSIIVGIVKNITHPKVLLTIHRAEVFKQLVKFISQFFNVSVIDSTHYDISGTVVIAMYKSLYSKMKKSVNVKKDLKKFNTLMVDECHQAGGKEYSSLLQNVDAPMRIFLSGSALENDDKVSNMVIVGLSGPPVFKISKKELMDAGVSKRVKVFMHHNPDMRRFRSYEQEYEEIVQMSELRADKIAEIIKSRPNKKILISFVERKQGYFLYDMLSDFDDLEIVHGTDPERPAKIERFRSGQTRILIASEILKEGVNIHDIDMCVYAQGGKEKISINQFSGRIERQDGKGGDVEFHDFWDEGEYVSKHSRARIAIYKKHEFEITYTYEQKRGRPTGQGRIDL